MLVVSGGQTITIEFDVENGYHLWRQLDTVIRGPNIQPSTAPDPAATE
jgi:hypothetical protein